MKRPSSSLRLLSGRAVRHRLLRRRTRRRRPLGHRQPVHLQPVARGIRDGVDVLRQRRPRGKRRSRLSADLHRPDADDRTVVGRYAQDPAHLEAEPHHLARRLHRLALRQERTARRPRHRHRGDRHPSLHLAAAEGGVEQLHDPRAVSGDRHARQGRRTGDPAGHGAVGGADPCRVHDRLRHAPSRRGRAPPGHGRRDRVRIAGEAARVPRRRRVRHLRHLRRFRRRVRARGGACRNCARC